MPDSDNYFTIIAFADQKTAPATAPSIQPAPTPILAHAAPTAPLNVQGSLRALAIIVDMDPNTDGHGAAYNPETVPTLTKKLFDLTSTSTASTTLTTYYKTVSFGKLSITGNVVEVEIPYRADFPRSITDLKKVTSLFPEINRAASSTLVAQSNIIYYAWPQLYSGLSGQAQGIGVRDEDMDGGSIVKGWIWINGVQPSGVYAHEAGHLLGLNHGDSIQNLSCLANTQNCTVDYFSGADINYYGDNQTMGSDSSLNSDLTSHDKARLGWVPDLAITKSGRYTIIGSQNPATQAMHIDKPDTKDKYYLESAAAPNCPFPWLHLLCLGYASISVERGAADTAKPQKTSVGEMLRIKGENSPIPTGILDGNTYFYDDATNSIAVDGLKENNVTPSALVFVRINTVSPIITAQKILGNFTLVSWNAIYPVAGTTVLYELDVCYPSGGVTPPGCYHITDTTKTTYVGESLRPNPPVGYFYMIKAYDTFPDLNLKDSSGQDIRYPIPFINLGLYADTSGKLVFSHFVSLPSNWMGKQ